tara:strand:+ start:202 stop:1932 length:1731 start_codon:yes stop_codon:yes gene_type:complete
MSEKIIKINSVQGFAASWDATPPTTLDLVDFTIPRGLTVDLSKSYIAFNCQTIHDQGDVVANVGLYVDVLDDIKYNVPSSSLIRNASITCDRGQIENIRRHDSLACALWGISNDAETQKGDLNMMGKFQDERGTNNTTSFLLDTVVNNTNPDGTPDGRKSRQIARDIKIPIKDIFGIGMAQDWSTNVFGETRIHLETNIGKRLKSVKLGGNENTSTAFDGTTPWGGCENVNLAAGATLSELTLAFPYTNLNVDLVCPFFVGESVDLDADDGIISDATGGGGTGYAATEVGNFTGGTGTGATYQVTAIGANGIITTFAIVSGGDGYTVGDTLTFDSGGGNATATVTTLIPPVTGNAIISQIEKVNTAGVKKVKITFATEIYTAGASAENLTGLTIVASNSQTDTIVVNRAELVLYTVQDDNPSESFNYMTYLTEQDNGNSRTELHRQYIVEPDCQNLLVANINDDKILPSNQYVSYRMSVDNEDVTGNRSVSVDTPLQYDRLNRCLNENSNIEWKNAQLKYYNSGATNQSLVYTSPISLICETMPLTPENKKVSLEIDATGHQVEQLILYKQVMRTI